MLEKLAQLVSEAKASIDAAINLAELDALRVKFLGKKGILTSQLKQIGQLPAPERPAFGEAVNTAKQQINEQIELQRSALQSQQLNKQLNEETLDITLEGRGHKQGSLHPITQTRLRIEQIFISLGFMVVEGPEVEDEYYNFEALNIPPHHPAREMHDTFYFGDGILLRTHTSPVQIRALKKMSPPLRLIAPGRVYRCDSDITHTPMFHQIEGLVVGENISFAELKGVLHEFLHCFFERQLALRFRPSYFPFTEPSAEVDIACVHCLGQGCRVCSHTGWLEVLGCGMVHPNVLAAVDIDHEVYSGFAFGLGVDRLAMLRYGITDLRLMFENDIRFLQQF
ncbi:MAG: phenylalanine--tRNA ligase subunit alpha [Gammaproteobacteria bacterium]